jgi:hypothetical protein
MFDSCSCKILGELWRSSGVKLLSHDYFCIVFKNMIDRLEFVVILFHALKMISSLETSPYPPSNITAWELGCLDFGIYLRSITSGSVFAKSAIHFSAGGRV